MGYSACTCQKLLAVGVDDLIFVGRVSDSRARAPTFPRVRLVEASGAEIPFADDSYRFLLLGSSSPILLSVIIRVDTNDSILGGQ